MSFAKYSNTDVNQHNNLEYLGGRFEEVDHGKLFEFAIRNKDELPMFAPINEFPHIIFVDNGNSVRYARVLKTVAYIIIDEDSDCKPVVEKWYIKNHKNYVY